jgi:hypothetical protein
MSDSGKLHIDDDWKAEARREKERLAEEIERTESAGMPESSFAEIVNTLALQAMVGLGGIAGPGGQRVPPNLEMAKHFIDLLDVLDQKTRGNLSDAEKRALDATLYNLRLVFVDLAGGAPPTPPPGPPGQTG